MAFYITPEGYKKIVDEYNWLHNTERPRITAEVSYAASLGDRSENSEYLYGKKRLREIDKRLHFLRTRLEKIEVVDPSKFVGETVRFGATVDIEFSDGTTESTEQSWTIRGEDEVDMENHVISYLAPLGQALIGREPDDVVVFESPRGKREITIVAVRYPRG